MGALAKTDMDGDQRKGNRKADVQISDKATFEEAIVATGFGKFNIILMIFIIPSSFSQASEQMGISYVLPVAECDLELNLAQKGMLSAITFAGMISSGPFMGVVCDTFGRRKLIIYGYFVHTICTILAATSTTVMQLFVAKFLCGFVFNGPFSAVTTYLSEFHSSEYRARVQIIRGITYATGFFILPLVAWLVLPLDLDYELFGKISIHSWNLFLLCCALSPLLASGTFFFMPESPKFLMSVGRNKEALEVFQKVYSMNSGKPKNDFPVQTLVNEVNESSVGAKKTIKGSVKEGWLRISPIFMPPYLYRLILASTVAMTVLTGLHTIKLWLPQILQLANDYQQEHNGTSTNVCAIIDILRNKKEQSSPGTCQVNTDNSFVYINSLIVNGAEIIVFFISGFFVNWIGKTRLMLMLSTIASICAIGIYFAPNSLILVVLSTIYIPALDLTGVMAVTITLEMFPTHFRTIAVSFHLMSARIGSLTANLLFPVLVATSCLAPFLFCCLLCAALPFLVFMYPNTENKALQ